MIFLLTLFLIFIPFIDQNSVIPILTEYEVSEISDTKPVIAIAFDMNDDSDINIDRYEAIKIGSLYFENAELALLDSLSSEYFTQEQEISVPAVFYISQGEILASYPYPESNAQFLYLCSLLSTPSSQLQAISTLSELYSSLNDNFPFTILSPPEIYDQSLKIQRQLGHELGFINVLKVSSDLLNSLGLNGQTIAFFRSEDKTAISTTCDLDGIRESSLPVYRILMPSDITSSESLVFSLFCDTLGDEEDTFLFDLGEKYLDSSLVVGLGTNIEQFAERFADGLGGNDDHQVLVFNFAGGYFYDASEYFDFDVFSSAEWMSSAARMVSDIFENILPPSYLSEKAEPEDLNGVTAVKVVGENYEKFVSDENFDVVVLYKRDGCPHCDEFFPIFLSFADECINKEKLTFVKFGFIDVEKNSSPKKFPFMMGVPHIQIFPAKNKSDDRPLRGPRDRDGLIRLLKDNSDHQIPFDAEPLDHGELAMELMQLLMMMDQIPENEKQGLLDDMNKLTELIKKMESANDTESSAYKETENNDHDKEKARKSIRNDIL